MGQYFVIANLDKKEFINPHRIMYETELWENAVNKMAAVFPFLLRASSGSSAGDVLCRSVHFGRWAGDRILVVGSRDAPELYQDVHGSPEWTDISLRILDSLNENITAREMKVDFMEG